MLDVHPPHQAAHSWREFLIHIATIVIGLLIAIALEQSVEALHHRHIVHVARESIHAELEANRKLAISDLRAIRSTEHDMQDNIRLMQNVATDPHAMDHSHMRFNFDWSSFNDSAWRTARDTGALALMPVDEVQGYADTYGQQAIVNTQAVALFEALPQAAAPLFFSPEASHLSADSIHDLLLGSTQMYLRLHTLEQLTDGLQK